MDFQYDADGNVVTLDGIEFEWDGENRPTTILVPRDYSPSIATWLSRDPAGENAGLNLHAFCGDDPVNRYDYLGMSDSDTSYGWNFGKFSWNKYGESLEFFVTYTLSGEERKCCFKVQRR